ncbi:MAG: PAS domain S-box protein [Anaerolineae bacterium]
MTEPAASITEAEGRHQARTVAGTLLLTLALIIVPLIQRSGSGEPTLPWILMLIGVGIAYGLSRTRFHREGSLVAILALWLLPTYTILLVGPSSGISFVLSIGRLLLLSLLLTYLVFSLRAGVILALMMVFVFVVSPSPVPSDTPSIQRASDFFLTTVAIFLIFVITRQHELNQRRQAEAAQHATEELYRAIVEVQTEMLVRWLPDTTLTFVNDAYCRYFGKPREELIGTKFSQVVLDKDFTIIRAAIASLTPEQPTTTYEHRVVTPSGSVGWLQWSDRAIYNDDGQIVEYQSVGRDITQRKLAEEALSAQEARYRAIVEMQTELICRWLPDQTLTYVNDAYCTYFDMTRDELIGSQVLALIYKDDVPLVESMIARVTCEQPVITYEHRVLNPAGEMRWHQWTDHAICNDDGQIVEYQSVGRDITNLKRAEEAEREEREFAEALSATAALISSTLNLDEVLDRILERVAALNPLNSAEVLLIDNGVAHIVRTRGYSTPEALRDVMLLRFDVQQTHNLRTMLATGKPIIITDVRSDPDWIDVEASRWIRSSCGAPIRLEGETIGFLNITSATPGVFNPQHATRLQAFADQAAIAIRNARMYDEVRRHAGELERQVAERTAELELERQRLRAILDGTGEGMFYTEDDKIQFVNVAFCKLTGYSPDELVGQSYMQLYEGDFQTPILVRAREEVRQHGVWRGEFHFRRKDGTLCDVGLTVSLIGSSSASPFRAVTVVRDISREKLLQAQRSNFVAYASHELRTPITNMKTRLYLLRRRPEFLEDHLAILDDVTERMRQLVDDLLDISRLEHGLIPLRRQEVTIQDVIEAVITLQKPEAERNNLDLRWSLPPEPVTVSGDRERLIQVMTNLLTNAINYTPSGGAVSVTLRGDDGSACIDVEDTGIGIAPENLPHIFQPFYRVVSEVEGTGLGLSIAKEIVELHGGALNVRSAPRHGSVFTITLPKSVRTG